MPPTSYVIILLSACRLDMLNRLALRGCLLRAQLFIEAWSLLSIRDMFSWSSPAWAVLALWAETTTLAQGIVRWT